MASRSFISLMSKPGHDRLAGAGVIGEKKSQAGLREHLLVDGFDLVRQRADAGKADGEMPVVGVGQSDARGLDEQAKALGIDGLNRGGGFGLLAKDGGRLLLRKDGLVGRAIAETDTALESVPDRADRLQDNRLCEMARQVVCDGRSGKRVRPCSIVLRTRISSFASLCPEVPGE